MTVLTDDQFMEFSDICELVGSDGCSMGTGAYARIRQLIIDRDQYREEQGEKGYIVFNGPFEVYANLNDAEERMRELVHNDTSAEPVVMTVALTEENNSLPLGIEMVVESRLAEPRSLS